MRKKDVLAIVESIGAIVPTDYLKSDEKCRFFVFVINEVFKVFKMMMEL